MAGYGALTASKILTTDSGKNLSSSTVAAADLFTPVLARAHASSQSPSSGVDLDIIWDNEDFDTASAFAATTTGLFTVPSTGKYQVIGSIMYSGTFSGIQDCFISVVKNGTVVSHNRSRPNTNGNTMQISDIIDCTAADTLNLQVNITGTGISIDNDNNGNILVISKVSN